MYVGTIHPAHYSCVKLMLEKGKSVVCENPLTMNVQDTLALIEMSKDRGLFLMEVYHVNSSVKQMGRALF